MTDDLPERLKILAMHLGDLDETMLLSAAQELHMLRQRAEKAEASDAESIAMYQQARGRAEKERARAEKERARAEKERARAEKAQAERDRLRDAALEVAAFRAQVMHGGFHHMSLMRALERLESALRQDEGGD